MVQSNDARLALRLLAVRRTFNLVSSNELPDLAADALAAGLDSPSLRLLAGKLHPTWADVGPTFDQVLVELSIPVLGRDEAGDVLARHYARQVVNGEISPYDGAAKIWHDVANQFDRQAAIYQRLAPFVGLASQWEDDAPRRSDYEREILQKAWQLIAQAETIRSNGMPLPDRADSN